MSDLATYFPITEPTWIFFVVLGIILFAPMLLERLRIPAIVGMIFAGVLIGPHGLHILDRDASFEIFGKVGLLYIMFLASLEMNMQDIKKIKGRAFTLGLLSFAFPILIGFGANYGLLKYGIAASVLMAAMYASHTLITYPIVMRYGLSRRRSVSIAVGGTIVADTLVLLVLAVVGGMFKESSTELSWLWLLGKVVILGLIIVITFPPMCRWFFRRYNEAVVQYIFVMALVFLGAGMMELVGMEGILGAFLVGLVLNRLIPPSSPLMSQIEFVGNALFIPYFLIGVGMLINVMAFVEHKGVFLIAAVMIVVCLLGKWLAAFCTQKIFRMDATERVLMFGLTNSRAAATLAVVLVGHGIILPDGSRLLDEDVLNGAMMLILFTCVISSLVTEHAAHKIAVGGGVVEPADSGWRDRMLIALSNRETVPSLVNAALMMREPKSSAPITALNVVLENDPEARNRGVEELDYAVKIAAAAGVRIATRSRWSVNVVSGISHTMKELDASDLLMGLHQKSRLTDTFFGQLTSGLLASIERQVIIYRAVTPISNVRLIHLLIPRKAEFEPGFDHWAARVAHLASQSSCRVVAYSGRGTLAALLASWEKGRHNVEAETHVYTEWHDLLPIARSMRQDDLMIFVSARRGTLSRHPYMDKLPEQIERYFSTRSLMIVYPIQLATGGGTTSVLRGGVPVKAR